MKKIVRLLAGFLAAVQLFIFTGCSKTENALSDTAKTFPQAKISAEALVSGEKQTGSDKLDDDTIQEGTLAIDDFTVRLLQQSISDKNILLSPLSTLCSLTMAMNGGKGETLSQMEEFLGDRDLLNSFLSTVSDLCTDDQLHLANSVWFRDTEELAVEKDFLTKAERFYGASVYKAPFDDTTLEDINHWASNKTNGMVQDILGQIDSLTMMYLINAVSFDAKWEEKYEKKQIKSETFLTEDGIERTVRMMYSEEENYLDGENAQGFLKYYAGKRYGFAALVPTNGMSMSDFIASLDGKALYKILNSQFSTTLEVSLPKFTAEYEANLQKSLQQLGMTDAFAEGIADFTGIATYHHQSLRMGPVLHKTYLELDEQGTKAAASTAAEMRTSCEPMQISLNRPFLYMIIDTYYKVPVFIGTMMDPGE